MSNVVVTKDAIKNASLEYIIFQRYQRNSSSKQVLDNIRNVCWENFPVDEKCFFLNMSLIERELKYRLYDVFYASLSKMEKVFFREYFKNNSSYSKISLQVAISSSQLVKIKNKLISEYKHLLQFDFLPSMLFNFKLMVSVAEILEEYIVIAEAYSKKGMLLSEKWLDYIYGKFIKVTQIIANIQKVFISDIEIPFFHKIIYEKQKNPRFQIQEISSICGVPGIYVSKSINFYKDFVLEK